MTTPERRALAVDFTLAGIALLGGGTIGGVPRSLDGLLIAAIPALAFVGVLAVTEHTNVLALVNETRPVSLVVASVSFLALGAILVLGPTVVDAPAATLLWGVGLGLGSYRIVYGVIRPIPAKRCEQARVWGTPPKIDDKPPAKRDTEEVADSHDPVEQKDNPTSGRRFE